MRHLNNNVKFGRSMAHRKALVEALVVALLKDKTIRTTARKAKVARVLAEKLVTTARKGDLNARRRAIAVLQDDVAVKALFETIVPQMEGRNGGYTRVTKLGQRSSDGSEMAVLSWVEKPAAAPTAPEAAPAAEAKPAEAK